MTEERCENCRFWNEGSLPTEGMGECRRYPPSVPLVSKVTELGIEVHETCTRCSGSLLMAGPATFDIDWCGEWTPDAETAIMRMGKETHGQR